jgi:membrane-bound lytic murein transglycosylase D
MRWLIATGFASLLLLESCATSAQPQRFRTYFVPPPARPKASVERPLVEAPPPGPDRFSGELPYLAPVSSSSLPSLPRPSDADFLIRRADSLFLTGKKAFLEGDLETSRRDFNQAVEVLMASPEESPDRARIERKLEELVEAIYRYDADSQLNAQKADVPEPFEKAPKDEILDLTFPVDPSLRNKVIEQLRATASQLPLEHNDAVVSYINFFTSERGRKIFSFGLKQSGRYQAMISRVLAQEGIPQEMIFLAQAESAFQPRAISRALCVGIWQFERHTGALYGLIPGAATDDRLDPEKATRAAAHHLHDLYTHFGDWYLAMAAYNCGEACVDHAVARTGYADFWELRRLNVLPRETANYVPVILAMTIIAKNLKEYGIEDPGSEPAFEYDSIDLVTPTHLALIAAAVDRPLSEIKDLNPAILRSVAPAGYTVHIPKGSAGLVDEAFGAIPENKRDSWRIHRVEAVDTFASLAKKYSTSTALIESANHAEFPEVGSVAVIPVSYPGDPAPVRKAAPARKTPATATTRAAAATTKKPVTPVKPVATGKNPVKIASMRRPGA